MTPWLFTFYKKAGRNSEAPDHMIWTNSGLADVNENLLLLDTPLDIGSDVQINGVAQTFHHFYDIKQQRIDMGEMFNICIKFKSILYAKILLLFLLIGHDRHGLSIDWQDGCKISDCFVVKFNKQSLIVFITLHAMWKS